MYRLSENHIKLENKKYVYFLITIFIVLTFSISIFSLYKNNFLNNEDTNILEFYFKNNIKQEYQNIIVIYTPLLIIGLFRIFIWFFKRMSSSLYKPISPVYQKYSKFSIVTAVYNEDVDIFKKALKSWLQNSPDEIIAVIDASDKHCIIKFKELAKKNPIMKLVVTDKPGKRHSLVQGIRKTRNEIIVLADSDTIWSNNIKNAILCPFNDPTIGGVTTKQHLIKRETIWEKFTDIYMNMRNYYDLPAQAAMGKKLSCLAGRTSAYRKEAIINNLNEFTNETIFQRKKESGEDKCLTRTIHKNGWKTYYQDNAIVYSKAETNFKKFWNQRLRWARNSHNSDLKCLSEKWVWKNPFIAFFIIDRFLSIFTLLFVAIFCGISIYLNHYIISLLIISIWIIGRTIKIIEHIKRNPDDLKIMPYYIVVHFIVNLIKLYALVTIRDQKSIRTRNKIKNISWIKLTKNYILTFEIICFMILYSLVLIK
ncbi:MAG: glycosyltransferase [Nitrososphaeraceae archaeon]